MTKYVVKLKGKELYYIKYKWVSLDKALILNSKSGVTNWLNNNVCEHYNGRMSMGVGLFTIDKKHNTNLTQKKDFEVKELILKVIK